MRPPLAILASVTERQAAHTGERARYWDEYADSPKRWEQIRRYYRQRLIAIYEFLIPPGKRILEIGCGRGELLASLSPSRGLGIDISRKMIEQARAAHPHLQFELSDAHTFVSQEKFDFIILSDVVNDLWDVQQVLKNISTLCHAQSRIVLNFHSRLWEIPRRIAEFCGLVKPQLTQNWLTSPDLANLLYLAQFEVIRTSQEIMWPVRTPLMDALCNRYLVKLWPFRELGITNFMIARPNPQPRPGPEPVVSVVVPARNESGNIPNILDRVPEMGAGTELIFVEGNSQDDTWSRIQTELAARQRPRTLALQQTGKGKGDAVRLGFAKASGELLMILDADLTVPPEDLPRFYEAWRSGKGEFINGVRLVYPMQEGACGSSTWWATSSSVSRSVGCWDRASRIRCAAPRCSAATTTKPSPPTAPISAVSILSATSTLFSARQNSI